MNRTVDPLIPLATTQWKTHLHLAGCGTKHAVEGEAVALAVAGPVTRWHHQVERSACNTYATKILAVRARCCVRRCAAAALETLRMAHRHQRLGPRRQSRHSLSQPRGAHGRTHGCCPSTPASTGTCTDGPCITSQSRSQRDIAVAVDQSSVAQQCMTGCPHGPPARRCAACGARPPARRCGPAPRSAPSAPPSAALPGLQPANRGSDYPQRQMITTAFMSAFSWHELVGLHICLAIRAVGLKLTSRPWPSVAASAAALADLRASTSACNCLLASACKHALADTSCLDMHTCRCEP